MRNTTLCYLIDNHHFLMLHRDKEPNDPNYLKWIGIGGKCQEEETIEASLLREVLEETGLELIDYTYRGIIDFQSNVAPAERMHLFTASSFKGTLKECDEGTLRWVHQNQLETLPMWEGDSQFLSLIKNNSPFFMMKLTYKEDRLLSIITEFPKMNLK